MGRPLPVFDPAALQEDALVREGWLRRFLAVGLRLEEATALYRSLGFDVRLEAPTAEDLREECSDCHEELQKYRVVYTRRPA
jgi:hypothetical protein